MEKGNTFNSSLTDTSQDGAGTANEDEIICGLILAGGEGKRLQPFVKSLGKGTLPKQYVNFIGRRSLLEHAFDRAERFIPPERVFTVVTGGTRRPAVKKLPGAYASLGKHFDGDRTRALTVLDNCA